MTRRTFAVAVRVLAVLAAIYTFFTFRSEFADQQRSRGAIPVKVVRESVCGWLTVTKASSASTEPIPVLEVNRGTIREAIRNRGEPLAVREPGQCGSLLKLNGSIVSTDIGRVKIDFRKAL